MRSRVVDKEKFSLIREITEFLSRNSDGGAGAIFFFIGKVRGRSKDGKAVEKVEIESYREGSNRRLAEISEEIEKKYGLQDVLIVHGEGTFYPGEDLVVVGVAGRRRRESIEAVSEAIASYKRKAFLFKKEIYEDGTGEWITE